MIKSSGEAVVIDPVFPIDDYLRIVNEHGSKITKVCDIHHHADHVSAAKVLSEETGAELHLSTYEEYTFKHNKLYDGDIYKFGSIELVIHTPGHTAANLSLIIGNKLLITGDTLLVNGVGRPDLRDRAQEFASILYDSLNEKLLNLSENLRVFPAHADGQARRGWLVTSSSDDIKKKSSLRDLKKAEFIKEIISSIMPTPPNHKLIISVNKNTNTLSLISQIHGLEMGPNRCSVSGA